MKRTNNEPMTTSNKMLIDLNGLKSMLSCGRSTAVQIADQAGASMKIGKRRLYSVRKIEAFIENESKGA